MVANVYILEYFAIGITTIFSLLCVFLMCTHKKSENDMMLENIIDVIENIKQEVHINHNTYLNKIKELQDYYDNNTQRLDTHINGLYDDNKLLEENIYKNIHTFEKDVLALNDILAKPILHFANVEPKIKQIVDTYIYKNSADTGAFQGWIGKSTFEDYSLDITIVKKEFKTFNENELWITNSINPDGVNVLIRMLFSLSFSCVIFPFYDVKWTSFENTMTLTSKMYEWNGSSDISMKFTFNIIPELTAIAYASWLQTFILNSESIFKNIVWEHTLVDI
jgi:hypothetical protein